MTSPDLPVAICGLDAIERAIESDDKANALRAVRNVRTLLGRVDKEMQRQSNALVLAYEEIRALEGNQ